MLRLPTLILSRLEGSFFLHLLFFCVDGVQRRQGNFETQGKVGLQVKATDADLVIEVEDTGVGISDEELPKIFDKFFRSTNPAVQDVTGTGLGLSMAHEVIRLHEGELTVKSELGKGSTFKATLPLK